MSPTSDRRRTIVLFAAIAAGWLWFIPYFPELNPPNESVRVYMTVAAVEEHTFAIDAVMRRWGYVNDKAKACTVDAAPREKIPDCPRGPGGARGCRCTLYSSKAPLTSYLGMPFHALNVLAHRLFAAAPAPADPRPAATAAAATTRPRPASSPAPADRGRPSRFSTFYVLRLFGAIVPGWLGVWLLWAALGRLDVSRFTREATTAGFALGSMHFTYSTQFVSHSQAGTALLAACLAIDAAARPRPATRAAPAGESFGPGPPAGAAAPGSSGPGAPATASTAPGPSGEKPWRLWLLAAGAGAATAAAPAFEYPTALAALCCGAFALWRLRPWIRFVPYALGAAVPVALVGFFHARAFGSPFNSGYAFLENQLFDKMMAPGFHGVHLPGLHGAAEALAVSLFSLPTGLFFFSPFLLLGPVGLYVALRAGPGAGEPVHGRPLAVTAVAVIAVMLAFLASLAIWRGGWQVGPRYIAAVVPFLALYAAVGAERLARALPVYGSALYAALVGVALVLTGLPTWVYPHLPEAFLNPVFDLVVPLLAHGHVPLTLASVAGVYGLAAAVPGLAAGAATVAWICAGPPGLARPARLTHAALAALFVASVTGLLSQLHFETSGTKETTERVVEKFYPPVPGAGDPAAALTAALRAHAPPDTLAPLYARAGQTDRALRAYRESIRLTPPANKVGVVPPR
ncbi:MAG TPA: hypothetical protein VG389_15895 [Myxococcota bacterium]|jgi:hypothetical protein|nr:hypothetical protein [Myxococcota bacterium]